MGEIQKWLELIKKKFYMDLDETYDYDLWCLKYLGEEEEESCRY